MVGLSVENPLKLVIIFYLMKYRPRLEHYVAKTKMSDIDTLLNDLDFIDSIGTAMPLKNNPFPPSEKKSPVSYSLHIYRFLYYLLHY